MTARTRSGRSGWGSILPSTWSSMRSSHTSATLCPCCVPPERHTCTHAQPHSHVTRAINDDVARRLTLGSDQPQTNEPSFLARGHFVMLPTLLPQAHTARNACFGRGRRSSESGPSTSPSAPPFPPSLSEPTEHAAPQAEGTI